MTDHGLIPPDSNFYFEFLVTWTCCSSASWLNCCWLQAIREDCLNHKPSSISAGFFAIPLGISLISCSYIQSHGTQSRTISHLILYLITAYFYMWRYSKDHHMQPKLGDTWYQDSWYFAGKKHCGSHLWWHDIIGYSHWLKSLKKLFFRKMFLYIAPMGLNINF